MVPDLVHIHCGSIVIVRFAKSREFANPARTTFQQRYHHFVDLRSRGKRRVTVVAVLTTR